MQISLLSAKLLTLTLSLNSDLGSLTQPLSGFLPHSDGGNAYIYLVGLWASMKHCIYIVGTQETVVTVINIISVTFILRAILMVNELALGF